MKYNGLLANLTTCLNAYIIFGKEFIESNESYVNLLLEMIWKAITLNPQAIIKKMAANCLITQSA